MKVLNQNMSNLDNNPNKHYITNNNKSYHDNNNLKNNNNDNNINENLCILALLITWNNMSYVIIIMATILMKTYVF